MILIKSIFYLISPIIFIIIVFLSPLITIRICFLSSERLGEWVYQIERYHLIEKKNKKTFDIFFTGSKISNNFYLKLIKKDIFCIRGIFIVPVFRILNFFSKYSNFFNKFLLGKNFKLDDLKNKNLVFNEANLFTSLSEDDIEKGNNFLKTLGINKNDKIVLLYVRDNQYLKKEFPDKDFSYHDYRDSDINTFIPSIDEITKKNYYVFRVGKSLKEKIKLNNQKFIDYSFLYRNEFLDLFLSYRCSFVVTTTGGFDALPSCVFRKPSLIINGVPPLPIILNFYSQCIYSLKSFYDQNQKKYLKFNELFKKNISNLYSTDQYINKNVKLVANSSDNIKDIVLEFIYKYENNIVNKCTPSQKKIFEILSKNLNLEESLYESKPRISEEFLKQNQYFISD